MLIRSFVGLLKVQERLWQSALLVICCWLEDRTRMKLTPVFCLPSIILKHRGSYRRLPNESDMAGVRFGSLTTFTRNGDINNHIVEHHLKTNHIIDWVSAKRVTYSTDYYQRITLETTRQTNKRPPINFTNNGPTDIRLTKVRSKRTNLRSQ